MASAVAIGATAFSTVSAIGSEERQAKAARAQGEYESAADEINAKIAHLQSVDAIERGDIEAFIRGEQGRQQVGQTRVSYAGQGVNVASGSAADAQGSEQFLTALDETTIRNNAARQAWGYDIQSADYLQRAQLARFIASNRAAAYESDEFTTLLTGASRAYGIFRQRPTGSSDVTPGISATGGTSQLFSSAARRLTVQDTMGLGRAPGTVPGIPLKPIRKFPWETP